MNTDTTKQTGEGNVSRVSVGANVRKAAKSLFDSYVYGGSSIEGIATTIVGYTPEHAALLALEVASYMTDLQERELRRAIRNDIARDAGQAYVQKEERAWSLNLPSGETYWYSTESAANEALADRAKLDAARLTV